MHSIEIFSFCMKGVRLPQTESMKAFFCTLCALVLALFPACLPQRTCQAQEQKIVYLTFDDGPTDSTTPKILDILKENDVKATFFVIGRQIGTRKEILRRTIAEGHKVGVHSYSHEYANIYSSAKALLDDADKCRRAILDAAPSWSGNLYRFPGGESGLKQELSKAVRGAGYKVCGWNASVEDAVSPGADADKLFENALRTAGDKDTIILLLHDGVGYKETIRCLPRLIDYYKKEGFSFATL